MLTRKIALYLGTSPLPLPAAPVLRTPGHRRRRSAVSRRALAHSRVEL